MGKFVENVRTIISDYIDGLKEISVRTIRPKPGSNLKIEHPSGATIELKRDGKVYINGTEGGGVTVEDDGSSTITTSNINFGSGLNVSLDGDGTLTVDSSSSDSVTNPLSADLDTGGYTMYNSNGTLTLESSDGTFEFRQR